MELLQNLHTHTEFCDGKNTCREQVERAIELGFKSIGFSGHGYTPFTLAYCMTEQGTKDYIEEQSVELANAILEEMHQLDDYGIDDENDDSEDDGTPSASA